MSAQGTLDRILSERLILVVRAKSRDDAAASIAAAVQGGVRVIEVTFTVPNAADLISDLSEDGRLLVGAGTTMTVGEAHAAMDAGARFVVSPGFDPEIVRYCIERDVLVIPGVLTPSEAMAAVAEGALAIKLFPASAVGPRYLAALRGPMPELTVIPSGGVDADNAADWIAAGAAAVGVGGRLSPDKTIDPSTAGSIELEARRTLAALHPPRKDGSQHGDNQV